MELRHLRCFVAVAVAEELHFARAADWLYIEQSPLSRAIEELKSHLAVQLFERATRRTRLTWAVIRREDQLQPATVKVLGKIPFRPNQDTVSAFRYAIDCLGSGPLSQSLETGHSRK
jgi:hypothetical protein